LHESIGRINNGVADGNSNDMFVTLFIARIDLKTLRMDFCNAGHNPLIVVPPDGDPYFLKVKSNLAVGLFENFSYETESIDLKPGTRLIAYTDGVTEAENAAMEQYGNERLMEEVCKIGRDTDNKTVVDQIHRSVMAFANGNPQNDDITILSLTV
jgi:serine phosphatase RsbU (regulator of sigma subunit)